MRLNALALALSLLSGTALAATRTETLKVSHMTCISCPYIVRHALLAVPGVSSAAVSYADKTASVTFDDARTDTAALVKATTNAGFPSELLK
jgi:mercuric ion binding protein